MFFFFIIKKIKKFFLQLQRDINDMNEKIHQKSEPTGTPDVGLMDIVTNGDESNITRNLGQLDESNMIFDECIKAYHLLSKRIQQLIVSNVVGDVFGGMKPYISL